MAPYLSPIVVKSSALMVIGCYLGHTPCNRQTSVNGYERHPVADAEMPDWRQNVHSWGFAFARVKNKHMDHEAKPRGLIAWSYPNCVGKNSSIKLQLWTNGFVLKEQRENKSLISIVQPWSMHSNILLLTFQVIIQTFQVWQISSIVWALIVRMFTKKSLITGIDWWNNWRITVSDDVHKHKAYLQAVEPSISLCLVPSIPPSLPTALSVSFSLSRSLYTSPLFPEQSFITMNCSFYSFKQVTRSTWSPGYNTASRVDNVH